MSQVYRPPTKSDRECKHWWFDGWDWFVNQALKGFGLPKIVGTADEVALDLHIHTLFSHCSISQPERIIRHAAKLGLDGIAIMDHDDTRGAEDAVRCADYLRHKQAIPDDFIVIPGIEISSNQGHIGSLFLTELVSDALSPEETVRRIQEAGGLAVAVHPYHSTGIGDAIFDAPFDAVEVECASVFPVDQADKNLQLVDEPRLEQAAKIGTSDAHYVNAVGSCYTLVKTEDRTVNGIRGALAAGSSKAVTTDACRRLRSRLGGVRKLK